MENLTIGELSQFILFLTAFIGGVIILLKYARSLGTKLVEPTVNATVEKMAQKINDNTNERIKNIENNWDDRLKKFEKIVNDEMNEIGADSCKNYLCRFLADKENGKELSDIEEQRAYDAFDKYTNKFNGNSYIHDKWEKVMNKKGRK